ncbi:MAG: ABC transporter substrate-binding protein, partial [Bacteroidota bacterium]
MHRLSKLVFVLVLALALVGQFAAAAPKTITITVNNGPSEGDEEKIRIMRAKIARFNKKYPHIKVITDPWIFSAESFAVRFAGRTETDIIGIAATEMVSMAENGYAADITAPMKKWKFYKDLELNFMSAAMRDGRIFGIPTHGYVMGLLYNKKLFKRAGIVDAKGEAKPPTTWEEFVEAAVKLTNRQKNQAGFGIMGTDRQGGWQTLNWVWQAGGDFERKVGGKWKAVFNEPEAVKAFEFIKDLRWKYDCLQPNVMVNAEKMFPLFAAEKVAMFMGTPEWIPVIVDKYGGNLADIGLALLPAGPAGYANQMGGICVFVSSHVTDPAKLDACFKWMTFEFELSEREEDCRTRLAQKQLVGIPETFLFKPEARRQYDRVIDKYRNFPKYEDYLNNAG